MTKLIAGPENPDRSMNLELENDLANSSLMTQLERPEVDEDSLETIWNASMEFRGNRPAQRQEGTRRVKDLRIIDCGDFALGINSAYPIYEAFFVNPQTGERLNSQPGFERVSKNVEGEIIAGRGRSNYLVNPKTGEEKLLGKNKYS